MADNRHQFIREIAKDLLAPVVEPGRVVTPGYYPSDMKLIGWVEIGTTTMREETVAGEGVEFETTVDFTAIRRQVARETAERSPREEAIDDLIDAIRSSMEEQRLPMPEEFTLETVAPSHWEYRGEARIKELPEGPGVAAIVRASLVYHIT